jgi:hypothetical protein
MRRAPQPASVIFVAGCPPGWDRTRSRPPAWERRPASSKPPPWHEQPIPDRREQIRELVKQARELLAERRHDIRAVLALAAG